MSFLGDITIGAIIMSRRHPSFPRFLTHRVRSKVLAGLMGVIAVAPASAGEDLSRPTLSLGVTLPAVYNNNFGPTRTDPVDGLNATPAAALTLEGKLSENLTYTAVAGVIVDRYDKTGYDGDIARSGFSLTYAVGGWTFGGSYEARWLFTAPFEDLQVRFDNFVFLATAPAFKLGRAGEIVLDLGYRERHATDVINSHHSPFMILTWSKQLEGVAKDWTLGAEFLVRYSVHDRGRPIDAKDWFASQEFSLTRTFTPNARLKFAVGHEARDSNILERDYDAWAVGATLVLTAQIF